MLRNLGMGLYKHLMNLDQISSGFVQKLINLCSYQFRNCLGLVLFIFRSVQLVFHRFDMLSIKSNIWSNVSTVTHVVRQIISVNIVFRGLSQIMTHYLVLIF